MGFAHWDRQVADLDVADGLITRMAVVVRGRLASATEGGTSVREQYRALVGHA